MSLFATSTAANDDKDEASAKVSELNSRYDYLKTPKLDNVNYLGPKRDGGVQASQAQATDAGPSAYGGIKVNPQYNQAQMAQMAALNNLAKNGGRSAQSEANLAQIQQRENANARGQRDAIMANMNARGQGNSGNALLAQLSSSQNATNNQSMQDLGVQANQQNTALQAGQGAANIASNMQNQSYGEQANAANAQDALARFNAGQRTGVSQFNAGANNAAAMYNSQLNQGVNDTNAKAGWATQDANNAVKQQGFANDMGLEGAKQGNDKQVLDYWNDKYKTDKKAEANQTGAVIGGITSLVASDGGRVPGSPQVGGDNRANDTVQAHLSPDEVVVPRTLAMHGSDSEIASFVKNPPAIQPADDRGDRLAALKSLASKRRG